MRSKSPFPEDAPSLAEGAEVWSRLSARLQDRARLDAEIVELTGRLARSGTIESLEGLTMDAALAVAHRLPQADRSMLVTAADVLADMPETRALFAVGRLSWGQIRGIVGEVRRLGRAERGIIDTRIGMSADRLPHMDPDDVVDATRVAAAELRDRRSVERSEDRVERGNFIWAQPAMFGPGRLYGELDNLSLGKLVSGIDAAAPPDDGRSLAQRRADGLVALATHRCGTHSAVAAPSVSIVVDTRDASVNAAGVVDIKAPGCLPTLTARAVEALAADATVEVMLADGARPLTVTRKVAAKTMSSQVRRAVLLRDGGDRFPGSRRPIDHVHHFDKRDRGHHVDFLAGLSDVSHQRVHRCGWHIRLDPSSGAMTFTRGDRQWTTLPRRTRLRRTPPPASGGDDGVP